MKPRSLLSQRAGALPHLAWHRSPLLGALLLGALLLGACSESGPRIYTARLYRAEARCLEPYAPLGVVHARELGADCEARCLRLDDALHVSTVCGPYPARARVVAADAADCALALDAFARGAPCARQDAGARGQGADAAPAGAVAPE